MQSLHSPLLTDSIRPCVQYTGSSLVFISLQFDFASSLFVHIYHSFCSLQTFTCLSLSLFFSMRVCVCSSFHLIDYCLFGSLSHTIAIHLSCSRSLLQKKQQQQQQLQLHIERFSLSLFLVHISCLFRSLSLSLFRSHFIHMYVSLSLSVRASPRRRKQKQRKSIYVVLDRYTYMCVMAALSE
jgi:hypothetical protein